MFVTLNSRILYGNYVEPTEMNLGAICVPFGLFSIGQKTTMACHPPCSLVGGMLILVRIYNLFSDHFMSVFSTVPAAPLHPTPLSVTAEVRMHEIIALKDGVNSGADQIPPLFIKRCWFILCAPLMLIFHKSLSSGSFNL